MNRLLIIGNSGFLGSTLSSMRADEEFTVDSIGRSHADLSQPLTSSFTEFLRLGNYTHAAICAAITDVEKCFREQSLSGQVNVTGTIELLNVLREFKIKPIFFSTDYVFRPSEKLLAENDERAPQTCYGKQKLAIEHYLENNFDKYLIFRTSKLMSMTNHPKNILLPVIKSIDEHKSIKCFTDQLMNPVFVEDIASVVRESVKHELIGTFHLGTRQVFTRYDLAQYLANAFGFEETKIEPIQMKDISFAEPRPKNNTLDCKKIEAALGFHFTEIESALPELIHYLRR